MMDVHTLYKGVNSIEADPDGLSVGQLTLLRVVLHGDDPVQYTNCSKQTAAGAKRTFHLEARRVSKCESS